MFVIEKGVETCVSYINFTMLLREWQRFFCSKPQLLKKHSRLPRKLIAFPVDETATGLVTSGVIDLEAQPH